MGNTHPSTADAVLIRHDLVQKIAQAETTLSALRSQYARLPVDHVSCDQLREAITSRCMQVFAWNAQIIRIDQQQKDAVVDVHAHTGEQKDAHTWWIAEGWI